MVLGYGFRDLSNGSLKVRPDKLPDPDRDIGLSVVGLERVGIDRAHGQSAKSALNPEARADSPDWRIAEGDSTQPGSGLDNVAILGGGCFWCIDGIYRMIEGVIEVVSGYAGGAEHTANYEAVCHGDTGHAEVVLVRFDPSRISYGKILKIFFAIAHDPTQLNRQGNDIGTQYRSVIFHMDAVQRAVAESYIRQLEEAAVFAAPITTEVAQLDAFHEGEPYHQDYVARNPAQPYIACFSAPKIEKLREYFPDMLKGRSAA